MERLRALAPAAYLVALLLVAIPLSEVVVSTLPAHPGTAHWRFGAAGMLSRALMTPLLGLLLAAGLAIALGHRRTLRTLTLLAVLGAAALLLLLPLFGLDALEVRARIQPAARGAFGLAAVQAAGKIVLAAVGLLLLARGGWRAGREAAEQEAGRRRAASPLLFTRPSAAPPVAAVGAGEAPPAEEASPAEEGPTES
ncbi:MAG TPA: hypothetical protein VF188_18590 [Longimicrobiales bacterium]